MHLHKSEFQYFSQLLFYNLFIAASKLMRDLRESKSMFSFLFSIQRARTPPGQAGSAPMFIWAGSRWLWDHFASFASFPPRTNYKSVRLVRPMIGNFNFSPYVSLSKGVGVLLIPFGSFSYVYLYHLRFIYFFIRLNMFLYMSMFM